jgi:peptidyl-prolyl cis-trans isomerase B (cyclophilin B)
LTVHAGGAYNRGFASLPVEKKGSVMRRIAAVVVILALGALAGRAAAPPAKDNAGSVRAVMELSQQFYYVGDPLTVRIAISNGGTSEAPNPVKGSLFTSFSVSDSQGKRLPPQAKPAAQEPSRPGKLASNEFYGATVELSQMYPQLKSKGKYSIRWSADGVSSDEIVVTIIPKFDPSKDYAARVETEEGEFVIDLLKRTAPIAVKTFVDLANAGFYDGLLLHEARADQAVGGGDPTGTGVGQAPIVYPAELAAIPIVAGSVVLKPAGLAPPANSSQFVISLRPEPGWIGQFTVMGQVVGGLDVVRKISNVPTSDRPKYKPLKDIHTVHVTIQEKTAPAGPVTGSNQ